VKVLHPSSERLGLWIAFLVGAVAFVFAPAAVTEPPDPDSFPATFSHLRDFQPLTAETGWVWLDDDLYRTTDAGRNWTLITPPTAGMELSAVSFADALLGWAILTQLEAGEVMRYALAHTTDGGQTWQTHSLALFEPHEVEALAGAVYVQFINERTGWLVVKRATSRNFNLGVLFRTDDGGATWERLSLPIGEPVHFTDEQVGVLAGDVMGDDAHLSYRTDDGGETWRAVASDAPQRPPAAGITHERQITPGVKWAVSTSSSCASNGICRQASRLLRTFDGGQTWQAMSLPETTPTETSFTETSLAPNVAGDRTLAFQGQGFDKCNYPSLTQGQAWAFPNSPYQAVNLYIGGSSRGCANSGLSASVLAQLTLQGWRFIPTWVGPQAACSGYNSRMSYDTGVAYAQGVAEANAAVDVATNLGLTMNDGSGTVLYYDLEIYDQGNTDFACQEAAKSFISGWSAQVRARGNTAGVYGIPRNLITFVGIANVPDVIWPASWVHSAYNASAHVWNLNYIDNSLWSNHQRIRQYAGGHDETWGGVTLNIDSNVSDGVVAVVPIYRGELVTYLYDNEMLVGSTQVAEVRLKNTGMNAWDADTYLAPGDVANPFHDASTWVSSTRITTTAGVAPNEERLYHFVLRAPAASGVYTINFGLVRENVGTSRLWFPRPSIGEIQFVISVNPPPTNTPTPSPTPTITPTPSRTPTPSSTPTPSMTSTPSQTPTPSETPTPTATRTPFTGTPEFAFFPLVVRDAGQ